MRRQTTRTPAKTSTRVLAGWLAPMLAAPTLAWGWVEFIDRSATHIVADPAVGLSDTFEKDLATGDVDRDGDVDLVVVRKEPFSTPGGQRNVLFMNEDGVLVDRTAAKIPSFLDETDDRDVVLVDVDGDGWLDIVTATTFSHQPRVYINLGPDMGGEWQGYMWEPGRIQPFNPGPRFCAVAAGDIDNDNDEDLFFVDYDNSLEDRLLINDGNGFFTDETLARMTAAMSQSAFGTDGQIVDMNGDGARDIIKISTLGGNPNSVRILYNAGGQNIGTFDFMQHAYQGSTYMMEVGDLNNDNRPDIYVVNDNQDTYLLNQDNDASGHVIFNTLTVSNSPATGGFGGNVKLADLDRNGFRDVLVADVDTDFPGCDRQPVVLRNLGNPPQVTLDDPLNGAQPTWMPNGTFDLVAADFNGDGWLDLWLGTCSGNRFFESPAPLFSDGFESGDTSAWSLAVP